MEKLKYFSTPEGQIHLRWSRLRSWFYVAIDQEPKSKSIKEKDKLYFQAKVLEELKKRRKRAYTIVPFEKCLGGNGSVSFAKE